MKKDRLFTRCAKIITTYGLVLQAGLPLAKASLNPEGDFYVLDRFRTIAPGAPDKINELNELDYYRWSYQVSAIVPKDAADEDMEAKTAQALDDLEFSALNAAKIKKDDLSDPTKKLEFEARFKTALLNELRLKSPGPFQPNIWNWYKNEVAYEKSYQKRLEDLTTNAKSWQAEFLAGRKFDADNAAIINDLKKSREDATTSTLSLALKSAVVLGVEWDRAHIEALRSLSTKRAGFIEANKKSLLDSFDSAPEADRELAVKAYEQALSDLKASPFLRPEIYRKIMEVKGPQRTEDLTVKSPICPDKKCVEDDYAIYIDVEKALDQTMSIEADKKINLPKYSAVGFDGYAIIEAPVDAVLSAYQFRNGVPPRASELAWKKTATYPTDGLYTYRREKSESLEDLWGPGAFLNTSIKQKPPALYGFVDGMSDSYAVLVRGNPKEGYDVVFQLLGKACFKEEGQDIRKCESGTKSNFTIVMMRPMGENRTAFKISGRYMGQSYKFKLDGVSTIGFSVDKFLRGQFEFTAIARKLGSSLKKLREAKDMIHLDSQKNGYFLPKGYELATAKPIGPNAKFDKNTMVQITEQQNFYLADGQLIQLIEDRGSQDFSDVPMQEFEVKNL